MFDIKEKIKKRKGSARKAGGCIIYSLILLLSFPLSANDCLSYKVFPRIEVMVPEWTKSIVQPPETMDLLHGNVAATFMEEYGLSAEGNPVKGGYCVVLTGVEASIGYTDFKIQIDRRHHPGSCGYNVTLDHEYQHIAAHLSVIEDLEQDIRRSIEAAAISIMPIFVPHDEDMSAALDQIERDLQSHPDIMLTRQQISAEQEIRNRRVDERDDGRRIIIECGI